jgi:hypothetical protein
MGLSVGGLAPFASADLLDWMAAESGMKGIGVENVLAKVGNAAAAPAHIVTSGDAAALPFPLSAPSLKAGGGLDPLAALFAEAGLPGELEGGGGRVSVDSLACSAARVAAPA